MQTKAPPQTHRPRRHIKQLNTKAITQAVDTNYFIGAAYDGTELIGEGTITNSVEGIGSGNVITSLSWNNLIASLGINVMSTREVAQTAPASLIYATQDQMHNFPFFHNNARLSNDRSTFNIITLGDAHPSPYLPRVYWHYNSTSSAWLDSDNWSGYTYPGQGANTAFTLINFI